MKLTKEQKMEMVSKAIDAGFKVNISAHFIEVEEALDVHADVFDSIPMTCVGDEKSHHAWMTTDISFDVNNRFSASIHLK